jgi:NADH dehydrogenase (ubiquinone) Fe-S protein 3
MSKVVISKVIKTGWVNKCFLSFLKKIIPAAVRKTLYSENSLVLKVTRTRLVSALKFLHSHILCQYKSLIDIIVYDTPASKFRFTVIYNLLSLAFNARLSVCVYTNEGLQLNSVCPLYNSANWLEREAWDLFGVFFYNHPDLRRILTDYGFNQHPLRKDFPLSGYKEVCYSEKEKRILHTSVEISQPYRVFSFKNF